MFNRKSMDHSWLKVEILVASRADFYFNAVIKNCKSNNISLFESNIINVVGI